MILLPILSYAQEPHLQWSKEFVSKNCDVLDITKDPNGFIYVCGVFADTGCTINYTGTGNTQLLNVYYDSTVSYFDDANLTSWSINYCTGTNYNYTNMATLPGQGCTLQNPTAGIDDNPTVESFPVVYPNPVSTIMYVYTETPEIIRLYDISGQLIYSQLLQTGENMIAVYDLQAGIYFYQIGDRAPMKMVKE